MYGVAYKAVIDGVETLLATVSDIKQIAVAEVPKVTTRPLAVINPVETPLETASLGGGIRSRMNCEILLLTLKTSPRTALEDASLILGKVADAFRNNRTLTGAATACVPESLAPATYQDRHRGPWYGMVLRVRILFDTV